LAQCTWHPLHTYIIVITVMPALLLQQNAYLAAAFHHFIATHFLGAPGNYWHQFQHVLHAVQCTGFCVDNVGGFLLACAI